MHGKIIKGIAGFYYVNVEDAGLYECKAKGIFRNQKIKPLVGDDVEIDVLDEEQKTGNIVNIKERKSELIRPAVANVDQAMIIFAAANPEPNFNLLDRFLVMMQMQQINTIICFNKVDLITEDRKTELFRMYEKSGCRLHFISVKKNQGMNEVKTLLQNKITVLAGPSGVGKSSFVNALWPEAEMETGGISEKIKRGKHTTRHSELIYLGDNSYLMDTPGFSSLYLSELMEDELKNWYPEFYTYEEQCRFIGCSHINEPDCAVKAAVDQGKINDSRYQNYRLIYQELKQIKRY